jgi:transcriptional regulator with XRE-family HTH domain
MPARRLAATTSIPLPLRQLRAEIALKDLKQKDLATQTGLNEGTVSQLLKGRLVDPRRLRILRKAIAEAPTPREVHA